MVAMYNMHQCKPFWKKPVDVENIKICHLKGLKDYYGISFAVCKRKTMSISKVIMFQLQKRTAGNLLKSCNLTER